MSRIKSHIHTLYLCATDFISRKIIGLELHGDGITNKDSNPTLILTNRGNKIMWDTKIKRCVLEIGVVRKVGRGAQEQPITGLKDFDAWNTQITQIRRGIRIEFGVIRVCERDIGILGWASSHCSRGGRRGREYLGGGLGRR